MIVKQKSIHNTPVIGPGFLLYPLLCALCISGAASLGFNDASAQTLTGGLDKVVSSVRLIAAKNKVGGRYQALIAITMKPGSHTYWRAPGDAGVPPVFAFDGSTNIMTPDVLFPAPSRIEEEGLVAFGYKDHIDLPLLVAPVDPAKPSFLQVTVDYAVCNQICIPAKATAMLSLPADDASADATIATALQSVPVPLPADQRNALSIDLVTGAAKPTWTLAWRGQAPLDDVFAEAPEGFAFDTRLAAPGRWTLTASQTVTGPGLQHVPVTLTMAGPERSFVTTRTIALPASRP